MSHARLSFEERKTIFKWHFKFENVVQVQCEWRREFATEPPTRLTISRIVHKLKPMVPCVMLIREIPGGFEHRQILLPQLWSWNLLHDHRKSLPHNVLVRQKLVERAYGAFLKQLGGNFTSQD